MKTFRSIITLECKRSVGFIQTHYQFIKHSSSLSFSVTKSYFKVTVYFPFIYFTDSSDPSHVCFLSVLNSSPTHTYSLKLCLTFTHWPIRTFTLTRHDTPSSVMVQIIGQICYLEFWNQYQCPVKYLRLAMKLFQIPDF